MRTRASAPVASIARTTAIDALSATWPKTTCFPFSHGVGASVMKNLESVKAYSCEERDALRAVRARPAVGHGKHALAHVFQVEVLVCKRAAVDALSPRPIAGRKI